MTLNREQLLAAAKMRVETEDVRSADYENVIYLLDHCTISVPAENRFFVKVNCDGIQREIYRLRAARFQPQWETRGLTEGIRCEAFTGGHDFGHTSIPWEDLVSLGMFGLWKRVGDYRERNRDNPEKQLFYRQLDAVYQAIFRFMKCAADNARDCGKAEMADGLLYLTQGMPRTLFEAMQTCFVYYVLQQMFDGTPLRTMGRIDAMFAPFAEGEDPDVLSDLVSGYVHEMDLLKVDANLPFALGGRDAEGRSRVNTLSYLFLDTYKAQKPVNVKLHLLCSRNTPEDFIRSGLDGVRKGKNSIVFLSDEKVVESLVRLGVEPVDAARYHVVGCYECSADGEIGSTCNARVNIPKALELTLNHGVDMLTGKQVIPCENGTFETFSDLYDRFVANLQYLCRCAMKTTDLIEAHYGKIHASPVFSSVYPAALEQGGDIYSDYSAKYNNSSVNAMGLGTAVDSLAAIRKLVYETHTLTLEELTEILKSDWEGKEPLRLTVQNRFPKYGNGDVAVDALAGRVVDAMYEAIAGVPNAKGGRWRLGLFSINWRWEFGLKTAASADGRRCGDPFSQNTGAAFGADRKGATAHLLSVCAIDAAKTPNGAIVDLDLHTSAVKGDNGLTAMYATLKSYFELGGFAVHYNVLDTDVLKDAKLHPENYPNLQVRLCGWNVLFSSLSEKEKDEFISRSVKDEAV